MKVLVILSEMYPYQTGEAFLGNELSYSLQFDKVILIPCFATDLSYNRMSHEAKEKVDLRIVSQPKKIELIFQIMRTFFLTNFWREIRSLKKRRKLNIKTFVLALKHTAIYEARYRNVAKLLKTENAKDDFIFYSYWLAAQAYIALKLKKTYCQSKVISRVHGIDLHEERHKEKYIPYREYFLSQLDHIYTIGESGKEYLLKRYPFASTDKISVSRLGTMSYVPIKPYAKEDAFRLVSCSSLIRVKRVEKIIQALRAIEDISIEWTHYGDGSEREWLLEIAKGLPANIKVHFAGNIPNEQLMQEYCLKHYDLFVNTSSSEGIPVSIMEAMSFGIPVVATDVGGTSECVIDGINGRLLDVNFTDEILSKNICAFAKMGESEYLQFRKNAQKTWADKYQAKVNYKEFYLRLLEGKVKNVGIKNSECSKEY